MCVNNLPTVVRLLGGGAAGNRTRVESDDLTNNHYTTKRHLARLYLAIYLYLKADVQYFTRWCSEGFKVWWSDH